MSRAVVQAGGQLVIWGRRENGFLEYADEFRDSAVHFYAVNVANDEAVKQAAQRMRADGLLVDSLVNNAYFGAAGGVEAPVGSLQSCIAGTVEQSLRCIKALLPELRKAPEARIVNIASMYGVVAPDLTVYDGFKAFTNPLGYGVGKAGLLQLSRYLAAELSDDQITVNSISPGPFPSQAVQEDRAFIDRLSRKTVTGRIGHPHELQSALLFLLGRGSSYVTGHNLIVDGGWTIT